MKINPIFLRSNRASYSGRVSGMWKKVAHLSRKRSHAQERYRTGILLDECFQSALLSLKNQKMQFIKVVWNFATSILWMGKMWRKLAHNKAITKFRTLFQKRGLESTFDDGIILLRSGICVWETKVVFFFFGDRCRCKMEYFRRR